MDLRVLALALAAATLALSPDRALAQAIADPAAAVKLDQAPAGTPVIIELVDAVSSKVNKRGDKFRLKLITPVIVNGEVLIAAGTPGIGEVIDAGSSGMLGKPAKLLLAARYLSVNDKRTPLRTLRLGAVGKDNSTAVMVASFVPYAGLLSVFIRGGEIEIPAGTLGQAKLAAPVYSPSSPVSGMTENDFLSIGEKPE